jgi:hypothetical protein
MFKTNEHVRIKGAPRGVGNPDEFARIDYKMKDGRYWVTNLSMPYMGSICRPMTVDQIEKIK